jgi:sterol desaturase/sphingolipid hydroxylase (fatty acid hydroxylase superfamily)
MLAKSLLHRARYLMLPGLGIFFAVLHYFMRGGTVLKVFPYFDTFITFVVMLVLERIWTYRHAVSQRHMIWRDLISTMMQSFFLAGIVAAVVLPILHYGPETFLGRRILFGLSDQLGPMWVQVLAAFLLTSFWGYWVHRFEHTNDFLWKLHGYHHSVTNVQISNVLVSNPLDFTFRNILGGLVLSIVGFNPVALVIAGSLSLGYGNFSHSGTDAKGGWLNYFFNGPEVHRWHHSTQFPDDSKFRYGCNFGVALTFWDLLFGTFYLPLDEHGDALAPPAIGHPEGYPDEPNYLKMLFAARCFPWLDRLLSAKSKDGSTVAVPAE